MIDITAIKARADKAVGAFITCVSGDGKPYVKFRFEALKDAQEFHRNTVTTQDVPALIAALEASESSRVKEERERDALKEALRHIVEMTDAENPESYRADDREGCLDTVHDTARRALESSK